MKVINFFGGPGISKSSMAASVFSELKWNGINAELIHEFAKEAAWEQRSKKFWNAQTYITGNQIWRQQMLLGDCDVAVTDSPIILGSVYAQGDSSDLARAREVLLFQEFRKFDNINILLKRVKPYNPKGRNQTLEEAIKLDEEIELLLYEHCIEYETFSGEKSSVQPIVEFLMRSL